MLSDTEQPFLQGWAIVENTMDEDWQGVRLSLISGRPISFTMDLYEPLYLKRPVVVPELHASLRPQVYGGAMDEGAHRELEEKARTIRGKRLDAVREAAPPSSATEFMYKRDLGRAEMDLQQGVVSAARAAELGELFQYAIKTPVSLARQKSAMLPIVNEEVEGSKVSVYSERVQAKHPLNGFRLKNSTALHLMQGPITGRFR